MADPTPAHILVLYEDSRRGAAAIQQAAELATRADALLTVVAVAVTEPTDTHCCDTRSVYWNGVVQELAAEDLVRARALLGAGAASEFKVATDRSVPMALAHEAQRSRADMIVVPSDRGFYPRSRSRRARRVKRRVPHTVVVASPAGGVPAGGAGAGLLALGLKDVARPAAAAGRTGDMRATRRMFAGYPGGRRTNRAK